VMNLLMGCLENSFHSVDITFFFHGVVSTFSVFPSCPLDIRRASGGLNETFLSAATLVAADYGFTCIYGMVWYGMDYGFT
jgi:hypothetical protein